MDGDTVLEGRVGICSDNQWGTICDDGWDNKDASQQLGFSIEGEYSNTLARSATPTDVLQLEQLKVRAFIY